MIIWVCDLIRRGLSFVAFFSRLAYVSIRACRPPESTTTTSRTSAACFECGQRWVAARTFVWVKACWCCCCSRCCCWWDCCCCWSWSRRRRRHHCLDLADEMNCDSRLDCRNCCYCPEWRWTKDDSWSDDWWRRLLMCCFWGCWCRRF